MINSGSGWVEPFVYIWIIDCTLALDCSSCLLSHLQCAFPITDISPQDLASTWVSTSSLLKITTGLLYIVWLSYWVIILLRCICFFLACALRCFYQTELSWAKSRDDVFRKLDTVFQDGALFILVKVVNWMHTSKTFSKLPQVSVLSKSMSFFDQVCWRPADFPHTWISRVYFTNANPWDFFIFINPNWSNCDDTKYYIRVFGCSKTWFNHFTAVPFVMVNMGKSFSASGCRVTCNSNCDHYAKITTQPSLFWEDSCRIISALGAPRRSEMTHTSSVKSRRQKIHKVIS